MRRLASTKSGGIPKIFRAAESIPSLLSLLYRSAEKILKTRKFGPTVVVIGSEVFNAFDAKIDAFVGDRLFDPILPLWGQLVCFWVPVPAFQVCVENSFNRSDLDDFGLAGRLGYTFFYVIIRSFFITSLVDGWLIVCWSLGCFHPLLSI